MSDDLTPEAPTPPPPPPPRPRRPPPAAPPRRAARLILGIAAMGLVTLTAGGIGAWFLVKDRLGGTVKEGSWLEVHVDDAISDSPEEGGMFMDPTHVPPLLTELSADIRRAATDERVTGLYLDIESLGVGWAGTEELYDAVAAFRASGKPCAAYSDAYDNKTYTLATACGQVYLPPGGLMVVTGFSVTAEYYAGTLEKVGAHANFEHVGDFKSAVEPYTRTGPSEPASEAMNLMLDGLYGGMVRNIARGRGVEEAVVRGWIDEAAVTPQMALDRKMIDGIKWRDEVAEEIAGKERTKLRAYREADGGGLLGGKTITVVHAEGAIVSGESGSPIFGGRMIGDRTVVKQLDELREDEDVVAVVLRVNSPGGSGLASDNIWRAVERLKAAGKPVVVSMGDYAASGGYYISAPADWIVAEPGTLTGSIGVFGGKLNLAGTWEKVGISTYTWQRGALSGIFSAYSDFSEPERARFRDFLQGFYGTFLDRVSKGRKMDPAAVEEVAKGRVWTGEQALERKLVDELGGLDTAIAKARALAEVGEEEVRIDRIPKRKNFVDQLLEDLEEQDAGARFGPELALPEVREAMGHLLLLDRVLADGVVAMPPYVLEF